MFSMHQTPNRGWGVKNVNPIHAGDLIIEYCGEIIDEAESDRRLEEMKARGEKNFYLFSVSPDHVRSFSFFLRLVFFHFIGYPCIGLFFRLSTPAPKEIWLDF
jgi:hypothetical protein